MDFQRDEVDNGQAEAEYQDDGGWEADAAQQADQEEGRQVLMPGAPQQFDDRNSAVHQPPTQDPSYFAKPAMGGGLDVGGRENLRAERKDIGPEHGTPSRPGNTGAPFGIRSFTDGNV